LTIRDIEDLGSAIVVKVLDTKILNKVKIKLNNFCFNFKQIAIIHHFGKVLCGNLQKVHRTDGIAL
jgi:hypothetical protein